MRKRHGNIDQIDGIEDLAENEKYLETCNYWKTGNMGTIFQTFLDVNNIIDKSNISEESKTEEKVRFSSCTSLECEAAILLSSSTFPAVFSGISCSASIKYGAFHTMYIVLLMRLKYKS